MEEEKKNNFVREEKMKWEIERRWQWWVGVRRWVIWTKSGLNHKGERGSFERKEKKKKNKQKGSPADSVLRSCVILAFVPDARAQDDFFFSSSYHLLGSRGGDLYRARFRHNFPLFIFIFFFLFTLRTPWGQGVIFIIISPFVGISIFVFLLLSPRRG